MSPLLLPIVIILRFTGEGKIFYYQERVGINGEKIFIIKFATMLENSPNMGSGTITTKNDPRILPLGRYLRKTKINELPQLINVLTGDMSVIGPRPLTKNNFNYYSAEQKKAILKVRPGLSGIGSIVFRNEEDLLGENEVPEKYYAKIIAPYKGDLECWFVENVSLQLYFALILITVFVVISPNFKYSKLKRQLPEPPSALRSVLGFEYR